MGGMPSLCTVGHGTMTAPAFAALLAGAEIELVVDVRRFPGSRRNPQFGSDQLARCLAEAGLGYEWAPSLGGRRNPSADSANTGLRNAQFRAYADHMATAEFRAGVAELLALAADRRVAVMCAESVWWRCHRRIITDYLLAAGESVFHIVASDVPEPARITAEARAQGDRLCYPGPQASLGLDSSR